MGVPARLRRQSNRYALVDGIPFQLPVTCQPSPALMAAFPIDAERAAALLPGNEVHPFRLWNRGLLVITVIHYLATNIGTYIEYSIAIACTHGRKRAPRLLPAVLMKHYGTGQYVVDLPVSTEISVKGGKGIWGMPKHQASLDFKITDRTVSSQYDLDGRLAMLIEVDRPRRTWLPLNIGTANYCGFRGLLMKSYIYFKGRAGLGLLGKASARLTIGDHPRLAPLKQLDIAPRPIFTAYIPDAIGVLDDYFESWFLSFDRTPGNPPEGLESVASLGLGQKWPPVPTATR
ncbi:MAG: acetoacetate decarboxylase family protein [Gemmatimonadales bacterium]